MTPFQVILLLVTMALVIFALVTSFSSTKASVSLIALKNYLTEIQKKLSVNSPVDAVRENTQMEILFNEVKSSCGQEEISSNPSLKILIKEISEKISMITNNIENDNKTSWLKFKASIKGFQSIYFDA